MLKRLLVSLFFGFTIASNIPGIPVPKAEVLDALLSKYTNKGDYTGAVFDYLKGNVPDNKENLDINVLDAYNAKKLIEKVKQDFQSRRGGKIYDPHLYYDQGKYNRDGNAIKDTCLNLMRQSIYATRYRMQDTKRYRKKFGKNISFNIAVMYGSLMQVQIKLHSLFSSMKRLLHWRWTHFLWYLFIYEKMLSANIDAHDMVERIFYLQGLWQKRVKGDRNVEIAPTLPIPTTLSRQRRPPRITATRAQVTLDPKNTAHTFRTTEGEDSYEPPPQTDGDKRETRPTEATEREETTETEYTKPTTTTTSTTTETTRSRRTHETTTLATPAPTGGEGDKATGGEQTGEPKTAAPKESTKIPNSLRRLMEEESDEELRDYYAEKIRDVEDPEDTASVVPRFGPY